MRALVASSSASMDFGTLRLLGICYKELGRLTGLRTICLFYLSDFGTSPSEILSKRIVMSRRAGTDNCTE